MGKIAPVIDEYRQELAGLQDEARQLGAKLAEKQHSITVLEAKIEGLEEAQQIVETKTRANKSPERKPRPLSGPWKDILTRLALDGPTEFGYDELGAAARAAEISDNRDNLRSQMSLYKTRGIVEPQSEGRFRLSKQGFDLLGLRYPYGSVANDFDDLSAPPGFRPQRMAPSFDDDLDSEVPF